MIRAVLAVAAVAFASPAHIEPQISEAPAGSRTTFAFLVEHGCDGSPTVQVSIQVPDGAFDVVAVAPAGWTGAVEDVAPPVVTFTGGPLAADVEETFSVELVTPNRPGETVFFPTVQTCEVGEVGWIDPAEESEEPAPWIVLTENPDPILPSEPEVTIEAQQSTTIPPATTAAPATDEAAEDEDDGGGEMLWPTLLVGLAIGIGVGIYLRYRALNRPVE